MTLPTLRHQIRCEECDQPMRWRGGGTRWEGNWQFDEYRYECRCAGVVTATVSYQTFIPVDVARMRQMREDEK